MEGAEADCYVYVVWLLLPAADANSFRALLSKDSVHQHELSHQVDESDKLNLLSMLIHDWKDDCLISRFIRQPPYLW